MGKALQDVRIADFSWSVAGPLCIRYLADHGAQVVHVESSLRVDGVRTIPPYKDNIPGLNRSGYFHNFNSNKLGLSLNLQHPMGRELAMRLAGWADMVAESYSPGVMKRLGLSYEDMKRVRPDIIMISLSSKGQTGPHAALPAVGMHLAALSGFIEITGWPDRDPALFYGAYTDSIAGRFGAISLLAALDHRRRTGRGQYIDLSQFEAGLQFLVPPILDYGINGRILGRNGNRSPCAAPHGAYQCMGEDSWCTIAVFTEDDWRALCLAMGNPSWANEEKFAQVEDRRRNEDELDARIQQWTRRHTPDEVVSKLQEAGVPAAIVETAEDLHRDPQLAARGHFWVLDHQEIGPSTYDGMGSKLSKTPAGLERAAPVLGQDNYFVCTEILGLSDDEFVELMEQQVLD